MSAYDKLAVFSSISNAKLWREKERDAGIFLAKGEKDAPMLDVSVWGIDKA